jgi:hypothetical protein
MASEAPPQGMAPQANPPAQEGEGQAQKPKQQHQQKQGRGGGGRGRNQGRGRGRGNEGRGRGRGEGRGDGPVGIAPTSGIPYGHVPAYLPGSSSLVEELDKRILIVLRDGRHIVGVSITLF